MNAFSVYSRNNTAYVSPSDDIMSPCSKKLSHLKGKRFQKYVFSFFIYPCWGSGGWMFSTMILTIYSQCRKAPVIVRQAGKEELREVDREPERREERSRGLNSWD